MRTIPIILLLCSSALADVKVNETTITGDKHGAVPRFSAIYQNKLIVAPGQVYNAPALTDVDTIEVAGIFRIPRDTPSIVRAINIQVLPGGSLDMGTETDPVLAPHQTIIKDAPLLCGTDGNLGPDPEQFGSGITVFGEWKAYGRKLNKTWTTMQPVQAGATMLTLADAVNWQAGDELLIPDTRQMRARDFSIQTDPNYTPPRRESPVKIAAINGQTITLSKPLDFEHLAAAGQLPYVANCTRNIGIRSENPQGTRGHTMFMDTAHVNLYYTSFLGLGRTLAKRLDNLDLHKGHVGENQVARYVVHWHHVHGHSDAQDLTGRLVGCYGDGSDFNKWFCVQHGTSDLLIADNVAERFVGACFSTEDGNEVRGQYLRNFAAYCKGNGSNGKFNVRPDQNNAPGAEGSGFWFHGPQQIIQGNVSINNAVGASFVYIAQVANPIPGTPGGPNDTPYDPVHALPIGFKDNAFQSNEVEGLELWKSPPGFTIENLASIYNGAHGVLCGQGEDCYVRLVNPKLRNLGGIGEGIHSARAYTGEVIVEGGEIEGFRVGGLSARNVVYRNCRLKNATNLGFNDFRYSEAPLLLDGVLFEKLAPDTQHLILGQGLGGPFEVSAPEPASRTKALNWQRTGRDYDLYENFNAPADAIALNGLVNAKAVLIGVTPPPVEPPPVDPCEALKKQVAELQAKVTALEAAGTADAATISQLKAKIEAAKAALQ